MAAFKIFFTVAFLRALVRVIAVFVATCFLAAVGFLVSGFEAGLRFALDRAGAGIIAASNSMPKIAPRSWPTRASSPPLSSRSRFPSATACETSS